MDFFHKHDPQWDFEDETEVVWEQLTLWDEDA